jgi:hypothetical protein
MPAPLIEMPIPPIAGPGAGPVAIPAPAPKPADIGGAGG